VKLTPSKRASPLVVANQRYLSAVCTMPRMESLGSPLEVVQTSWPNWVSARFGFSPQPTPEAKANANRLVRHADTFDLSAGIEKTLEPDDQPTGRLCAGPYKLLLSS
jgi:hypothetical protein